MSRDSSFFLGGGGVGGKIPRRKERWIDGICRGWGER